MQIATILLLFVVRLMLRRYQAIIFLNIGLAEFWWHFSRKFDFAT